MISINDISLAVFIAVITLSLYYLIRSITTVLNEYRIKYKQDILEVETYVRDLNERIKLIEKENQELKRLVAELSSSRRSQVTEMPRKREKIKIEGRKERRELNKTEIEIINLLLREGKQTSSDIREKLDLSREHVARTLKKLYEKGYVIRDENEKPFTYYINEEKKKEIEELIR